MKHESATASQKADTRMERHQKNNNNADMVQNIHELNHVEETGTPEKCKSCCINQESLDDQIINKTL